jgi:hypothetical protein
MTTPYGLPKETLDNWKFPVHASFWTRLKIRLLGKKIVELDDGWLSVWYVYKDTLYLSDLRKAWD